jgi:flavin reductase (DIM6/NTAB) family NADH-FMN oxidoreductase RutF
VAFASTMDAEGRPEPEPLQFLQRFRRESPALIFSPARRGRDNTTKHSYHNVKAVPEVVINVVTYAMVHQTSLASTEYPEGVNEFEKAGFTPIASEKVRPFRVKESPGAVRMQGEASDRDRHRRWRGQPRASVKW